LLKYIAILFFLLIPFPNTFCQDTIPKIEHNNTVLQDPDNIDIRLFRTVNNNRSKILDNILPVTDITVFPLSIVIPPTMIIYGHNKNNYYDENSGVLLGLSEFLMLGTSSGIKYLIKRKRPYISLSNVHKRDLGFADPYSFPSGHTAAAFTITTMFTLRYIKYPYVYIPMYAWSLVVGYGRAYFGMHYPTDIAGGAIIGTLSSVLIYSLRSEIIKVKNRIFRENNKPDSNVNTKFAGLFGSSFLITGFLNDFIFPVDKKYQMYLSTSSLYDLNSFQVQFKLAF
jgi:membrane-associated phospholipid phosphatase